MSNTVNISEKIVSLRKAKKWSQSDLAKNIKASREIVGKYERCAARVSIFFCSASKVCARRQRCKDKAIDHSPGFS